nr:MAG TPA: hypothetical protein [Caudoviricetes sp.]
MNLTSDAHATHLVNQPIAHIAVVAASKIVICVTSFVVLPQL